MSIYKRAATALRNKLDKEDYAMTFKTYLMPEIDILLFDEEEVYANTSNIYAAERMNNYMFGGSTHANGTTTIKLERAVGVE